MQNLPQIGPFVSYCYPIWFGPNLTSNQASYFNPLPFYPQFMPTVMEQSFNLQSLNQENTKTIDQNPPTCKKQAKDSKIEVKKIIKDVQKKTCTNQTSQQHKKNISQQPLKTKRPQTYETQKSFYMKQKIKGKMKCNYRILRKRNLDTGIVNIKTKLRTSESKISKETKKLYPKKHKIIKQEVKKEKNHKKLKPKFLKEFYDNIAEVPSLILGIKQLNYFICDKLQNLKLRHLIKK